MLGLEIKIIKGIKMYLYLQKANKLLAGFLFFICVISWGVRFPSNCH